MLIRFGSCGWDLDGEGNRVSPIGQVELDTDGELHAFGGRFHDLGQAARALSGCDIEALGDACRAFGCDYEPVDHDPAVLDVRTAHAAFSDASASVCLHEALLDEVERW